MPYLVLGYATGTGAPPAFGNVMIGGGNTYTVKSADGITWEVVPKANHLVGGGYQSVTAFRSGNGVPLYGFEGEVTISNDAFSTAPAAKYDPNPNNSGSVRQHCITFTGSEFVVMPQGSTGEEISRSTDGINWNVETISTTNLARISNDHTGGIIYVGGTLTLMGIDAAGTNGNSYYNIGSGWVHNPNPLTTGSAGRPGYVSVVNGRAFATSTNHSQPIYYSDDGITWTAGGSIQFPEAPVWGDGTDVFGLGRIYTNPHQLVLYKSTDGGISWSNISTIVTDIAANPYNRGGYFNGLHLVTYRKNSGSEQYVARSADGVNWTETQLPAPDGGSWPNIINMIEPVST